YRPIPGSPGKDPGASGLSFPAFGFPSAEAVTGVRLQTSSRSIDIPGLGGANGGQANALCIIDVSTPSNPTVEAFIHPGTSFGERALGGSSPSAVIAAGGRLFVANAGNDSISVIDPAAHRVEGEIHLRIPGLETLRGVLPIGLAYHEQSGWLLVAEAGIN